MTFPARLNLTVLLNGVDVSDYVVPGNFRITSALTHEIDTLSITLDDAGALNVQAWQEVVVLDGAERIFAGYVLDITETEGDNLNVRLSMDGSDYAVYLEKIKIKAQYEDASDADIIADIFSDYLPGMGYDVATHVKPIKVHPRIRFNRVSVLDAIKTLSALAGAQWYVDFDKKLHYFATSTENAPFGLSDNPDYSGSYPYYDFKLSRDGSDVINRVEIVGGYYLSDDDTFYLPGTGQDPRIALPFKLHAPTGQSAVLIWRNDGTAGAPVWTALAVKIGYIDTLENPNDVLFFYQDKVIEAQANWPNLPNAVKITARYDVPLRTKQINQASVDFYGMYFDAVIVNDDITDKVTAKMKAASVLAENAIEKEVISLNTDQPGLRSGQLVSITNAICGVSGIYMIRKTSVTIGINGKARYNVSLGAHSPDLIEMLATLTKQLNKPATWREDEVLDEVSLTSETVSLAHTNSYALFQGPYYFSDVLSEAFEFGYGAFE